MIAGVPTPLVHLGNLFPNRRVYAKCEFLSPSGSFKIRGTRHLLSHLGRRGPLPPLIVPSMGNTALGVAVGAKVVGASVVGVVPKTIGRDKDAKLQALGVDLIKIDGGGSDLLDAARRLAEERRGYFVHPHLDSLWTDGYQGMVEEILTDLPECRSLVFPVGGGGLLMGLTAYFIRRPRNVKLIGCEPFNYPKYAAFNHPRTTTIADGLLLDVPHPAVQQRIAEAGVAIRLVPEEAIRHALAGLYRTQGLIVEPSSAIAAALVQTQGDDVEEPICLILTGENIGREEYLRLIAAADIAR
jgi:threonine dehydratase